MDLRKIEAKVCENPRDAAAWDELAAAHRKTGNAVAARFAETVAEVLRRPPEARTVFVVGFVPEPGRRSSSVGGFDWFRSKAAAQKCLLRHQASGMRRLYRFAEVTVPGGVEDVTAWLDEREELWEPPG